MRFPAPLCVLVFLTLRAAAPADLPLGPCSEPHLEGGRCGTLEIWENREAGRGRKIPIRVAVLPALEPGEAVPLFYLGGGPGASAIAEGGAAFAEELAPLRQRHEVVLVDLRGTGGSNPLPCALWGDGTRLDHLFPRDAVKTCRRDLEKRADLARYTTETAMEDLDEVRRRLGYERIDLLGESYGTLAAQVYMRRHPEAVRAAAFAGTVRLGDGAPLQHASNAQRAFELLLARCESEADCRAAYPRARQDLEAVLDRLSHRPVRVRIVHPVTQRPVTVRLTRSAAAEAIRLGLYSSTRPPARTLEALRQAAAGDFTGLARKAVAGRRALSEELALGLFLSVTCAEDVVRIDPAKIPEATRGTFYGDDRVREHLAACALWPRGTVAADYAEPLRVDVPVLLISGERDPVTPPEDAAFVARHLPRGRLVNVPDSHELTGSCAVGLIAQFLDRGTTDGLDTGCLGSR